MLICGILIKRFDQHKVAAQGNSTQCMDGGGSPQMIKMVKAALFEKVTSSSGINCGFLFLEFILAVLSRGMQHIVLV